MLIHNAYFWLRKDLSTEDRAIFERELMELSKISYLERGFAGASAPIEKRAVTDNSFDYATSLHFKSLDDHEYYQKECKVHAKFVSTCKSYWVKVLIYDINANVS